MNRGRCQGTYRGGVRRGSSPVVAVRRDLSDPAAPMSLGGNAEDWWKSTSDEGPVVDRDSSDSLITPLGGDEGEDS